MPSDAFRDTDNAWGSLDQRQPRLPNALAVASGVGVRARRLEMAGWAKPSSGYRQTGVFIGTLLGGVLLGLALLDRWASQPRSQRSRCLPRSGTRLKTPTTMGG